MTALLAGLALAAPPADALLGAARREARRTGKAVFVAFGASWCKDCHRLGAFLRSESARPALGRRFVLLDLDVDEPPARKARENPGAAALRDRLGLREGGLPVYAALGPDGRTLATSMEGGHNLGFPLYGENVKGFLRLVRRAAPKATDDELWALRRALEAWAPEG